MRVIICFLRAVLAAVGFAYLPADAHAQCVIVDKPEDLFARSDMVFRGTVVATVSTGAEGAHQVLEVTTFRVDQSWKGHPAREVRVGADGHWRRARSTGALRSFVCSYAVDDWTGCRLSAGQLMVKLGVAFVPVVLKSL